MIEHKLSERGSELRTVDFAALSGRLLAFLIIAGSLALGIKAVSDFDGSGADQFWVFVNVTVQPLGIGFLIFVASDIVNRLRSRSRLLASAE